MSPTVRQQVGLVGLLALQCELYNAALEERRGAWRWERRSISYVDQCRTLTSLREVRPEVLASGVRVCRGTLGVSTGRSLGSIGAVGPGSGRGTPVPPPEPLGFAPVRRPQRMARRRGGPASSPIRGGRTQGAFASPAPRDRQGHHLSLIHISE